MTQDNSDGRQTDGSNGSVVDRLTRRESLKIGSGIAIGTAAAGLAGSAAADSHAGIDNVIEVPAGETHVIDVSEREDNTLENTLIDASADGAGVFIDAEAPEWTIRNVGVIGPIDESVWRMIAMQVTSSDGVGTIDNVYLEKTKQNFIFTNAYHEGHIDIKNSSFINNMGDNEDLIYGSPPGNPDASWPKDTGREGTITMENCYGEQIDGYGFRLGSDGSKVINSTLNQVQVGLANLYGRPVEFRDVDVVGASLGLRLGDHVNGDVEGLTKAPKTIVDNVRIDANRVVSGNEHQGNAPELVGTIRSDPDPTPPKSAPKSAGEAARGHPGNS